MTDKILLVDDEENVVLSMKRLLFDELFEVITATSGEEALEVMKTQSFKLVISDERMPGIQGTDFLAQVKDLYPNTVRIMLTGHATLEAAMKAVNSGEIYRFFAKPWNNQEIIFAIRSALEKFDLEEENRLLLATVKSQAKEIKALEKQYPGILEVNRDNNGFLILPELSSAEISELFGQCEQKYGVKLSES